MSDEGPRHRRPGKLSALLESGRLDALLRDGGVRLGDNTTRVPDETEPDVEPRRAGLARAVLDRIDRRDARLRERDAAPLVDPTPLDEVVAALPDAPQLSREPRDKGTLTSITWRYPVHASHGRHRHDDALGASTAHLATALRDERLREFDVRKALFLDIESTGLSHGAGTYAFLVGLAWFEADELVLTELFLEDLNDETAMLEELSRLRAAFDYLVSFNGRCYDVHVLQSRLVINRIYDEGMSTLQLTPHVDLLHLARSVHGGRFEDSRLQTLERELLGVTRTGDVPSALIPSLYFSYLMTDDVAPLAPVLRHNAVDVISMVALYAELASTLGADVRLLPAAVRANLGHLWLSRRRAERATRALLSALDDESTLPEAVRDRSFNDLVTSLKRLIAAAPRARRAGLVGRLEGILNRLVALHPDDPEPHIELARLHERHTRDRRAALLHARAGLDRLPPTASAAERERERRRVDRLSPQRPASR